MIPAKIDLTSLPAIREKGVISIADWFDQHIHLFYTLGWSYVRNQEQMEELLYRSIIKVHKELPRFKRETSFGTWVTSMFIRICRELSENKSLQASEESEPSHDLFKVLNHLQENEKEAIVLTYIIGISKEETAYLLEVSVEKIKELLFSGIQSFRKEMGDETVFNGCKEYHTYYIDYLERNLCRSKKIDLEKHIYHCQDCQEDLAAFQDVMLSMLNLAERIEDLQLPSALMKTVKDRLAEKEKNRIHRNKKRKRKGLVFASIFALLIGTEFFTGAFTRLYYTWKEENQELRPYLEKDLGERLNLEAESGGVKVKIKSAIADEVQTLVFYEIEDTKEKNQYVMNYDDGVLVENEYEILNREVNSIYYPPDLNSDLNKKEKNIYQGKISLPPLSKDNGTIKLNITKLQKLNHQSSNRNGVSAYENMGYQTGEWNFEIPVNKQRSAEYALNGETEVDGIPVRFEKLTIAPTVTILQYGFKNEQTKKRIDALNFDNLEVNNKKVKADRHGSSFSDSSQDMNWNTFQKNFEPLFREKPKELNVQFESVNLTIEEQKSIEFDASEKYPKTFEYANSTISIDKVEVGQPTKIVISNHEIKNRAYESLQFNIVGEGENETSSMEMNSEGVLVDKNGVEYDLNQTPLSYEEIEQPRYFSTVVSIELDREKTGEKVIPKSLEIYGYNTTEYLEDVVNISIK
ncbi:DUF4179 domain-containing protein [Neobacillus vireti]|uniref:DUF4179 domain-containing protein n=1 Tax=Neobacillus vireti TaxID=220686 RepID=UPI002FFDFF18